MTMRRLASMMLMLAMVGAGCSGDLEASSTTVLETTSTVTPTTTGVPTTSQAPPTTLGPNPLTDRLISRDMLELMPLRRISGSLSGFSVSELRREDNAAAVARLPFSFGEAEDVVRYDRQDGYRAVLRPSRLATGSILAIDSWVVLFRSDEGAAGYLQDFAGDIAKGEDAGHGAELRVVAAEDFVVDELGDSAIGLTMAEETVYGVTGLEETLIGFQIGRLLGFVSVLRSEEGDFRIPTLFAAQDMAERVLGVLDGSIQPVVEPEPATLAAYQFSYRQTLMESYLRVVYPEPVLEDPPPGEGEPPGDGSGEPPGENQSGDEGSTTTTSSTTTTTTTLLVPTTDITTIDSNGIVVDQIGRDCTVQIGSDFGVERNHVIVLGDAAWRSTLAGGEEIFDEVDPDDEITAADLIYCPGWDPSMAVSGIDLVVTPGLGEMVEWEDGTSVERFELGRDALVTLGIAPEGGGGIDLDEFVVYLGGEEPWVVGIDLSFRGTTAEMEAALGPGFRSGADIVIEVEFRITNINDPELVVAEPAPESIGLRLGDQ